MERLDRDEQIQKDEAYYQVMYHSLFQDVTDALEVLKDSKDEHANAASRILESGQCRTEEIYIQSEIR